MHSAYRIYRTLRNLYRVAFCYSPWTRHDYGCDLVKISSLDNDVSPWITIDILFYLHLWAYPNIIMVSYRAISGIGFCAVMDYDFDAVL